MGEEIVLSPNFVGGCKNIYIHSWDNVVTHEYHPPTFLSFFFYFPIPKTSPTPTCCRLFYLHPSFNVLIIEEIEMIANFSLRPKPPPKLLLPPTHICLRGNSFYSSFFCFLQHSLCTKKDFFFLLLTFHY